MAPVPHTTIVDVGYYKVYFILFYLFLNLVVQKEQHKLLFLCHINLQLTPPPLIPLDPGSEPMGTPNHRPAEQTKTVNNHANETVNARTNKNCEQHPPEGLPEWNPSPQLGHISHTPAAVGVVDKVLFSY